MRSVDDWTAATRGAFDTGIPNGWELEWDRARFEKEVAARARPWKCFNATSFDYARCNKYEIECGSEATGHYVLTILVSFVVDSYIAHWTHYTERGRAGVVVTGPGERALGTVEQAVISFLEGEGFEEMPADIYRTKVEGIALELSEPDEVTIGKCCFEDFDG